MPDEDLALLDRWCAGDARAGNLLFKSYFPSVYRFFARKVDGSVDDLTQETFLACVQKRESFQRQSTFRTYLFAIARHKLYDYWKQAAKRSMAVDFEQSSVASLSTSIVSKLVRQDDRARLLEALRALPLEQQLLLELHYWEQLENDHLAEIFEVESPTIRSRLFRARHALREHLGAAAPQAGAEQLPDEALDAWARALRPTMERSPERHPQGHD
ncbi:MAG: RNA polymerase sigma factor [Kofleriaceae bacterium]